MPEAKTGVYERGIMATFETGEELNGACSRLEDRGLGPWETFSPYPEEGIQDLQTTRLRRSVSRWVLRGGITALFVGYAVLYFSSVIDYPYRVGGRPLHSWPAFVPILFELTVLGSAVTAVGVALLGNGMPAWAHPVFFCEGFETATGTGRFLWVSCSDESEFEGVEALLRDSGATRVQRKDGGA